MSLGSPPLFDTTLLTASWVNSAMAAASSGGPGGAAKASSSGTNGDDLYSFMQPQQQGSTAGSNLDFVSMLGGGFAQPTFLSPPDGASNGNNGSYATGTGAGTAAGQCQQGKGGHQHQHQNQHQSHTQQHQQQHQQTDADNALQLDHVESTTNHSLSPSITTTSPSEYDGPAGHGAGTGGATTGTHSGYASPAFQLSPTPGLTMCPTTADSTPGPRSNSRCSSRSSFSYPEMDGTHSGRTSGTCTPASTPGSIRKVIGGHHGRKNSAVANGTFTPKRPHLCTYADCERSTRTFRSNADLQRHLRSHKGERPYACPAQNCGKAYGQQNKMVKHVEQQHPMLLPRVEMNRTRTRRATAAAVVDAASRNRRVSVPGMGGLGQGHPGSAAAAMSIAASAYPLAYAQHVAKHGGGHDLHHGGQRSDGSAARPYHTSPLAAGTQYSRPGPYPHPAALALAQQQQQALQRSQQAQARGYGALAQGIQLQGQESQWWAKALGN